MVQNHSDFANAEPHHLVHYMLLANPPVYLGTAVDSAIGSPLYGMGRTTTREIPSARSFEAAWTSMVGGGMPDAAVSQGRGY